jgi:hypothetical protein
MTLIKKQLSYFFNSAEAAGAVKIGSLGNRFRISLNSPIHIPASAKYATLHVPTAAVWNNSPNISATIGNNKLYFSYEGTPHVISIADGLYGVSDIDSICSIFFTNNTLPSDLFEISSNDSTQKITITFNYPDIIFDFTQPDVCRDVLGFDSQAFGPFTAPSVQTAPNIAAFNRVVNFFIRSTLLSGGIPQNLTSNGIIADVPITAPVGSLVNYEPVHPIKSDATELIGNPKQTFTFALMDQLEREISTMGEEYSLSVVIEYWVDV